MNRWLIRSVQIAALSLGGLALTGTAAHADWRSGPNVGAFNGNQSSTTVQVPINVCGNSIAIIGFASANCSGGAYAYNGSGGSYSGAGNSNGGGNSYHSHSHKKSNANSNSAKSNNKKAKSNKAKSNSSKSHSHSNNYYGSNNSSGSGSGSGSGGGGAYAYNNNGGNWSTGYNVGFFNGNQSSTTFQMPINVSCNSVAVVGFAQSC